jgi:histidine ammonia-lyase
MTMIHFPLQANTRLTLADVVAASKGPLRVTFAPDVIDRIRKARAVVDAHVDGDLPVYGLNTGLGGNVGHRIKPEEIPAFQEQMVRGRIAGVGEPLSVETCRAALFCRIVALAKGGGGISPHVLEQMVEMLARDVVPAIPSRGSLGTGDLIILMSVAAVAIGRGRAWVGGRLLPGAEALASAGLKAVTLGAKDGLAIANASSVTVAMAALSLQAVRDILNVHVAAATLACEGYGANPRIFDERLALARPARGQVEAAALFRKGLEGSDLHGNARLVQDAISFRALSQVTGSTFAAYEAAKEAAEIELNATADNPLVIAETGEIHSSANFHTPAIALAFDSLAIAMTHLATASANRSIKLMTGRLSGVPNYLSPVGGASAGFVPMQKAISALQAEVRLKAAPASLDGLAVSDTVEDLTPHSALTIRKLDEQNELTRWLVTIETMLAAQACDLRAAGKPRTFGKVGTKLQAMVRAVIPALDTDRETGPDAETLHEALWQAQTVAAIQALFD